MLSELKFSRVLKCAPAPPSQVQAEEPAHATTLSSSAATWLQMCVQYLWRVLELDGRFSVRKSSCTGSTIA